MIATLGIVTAGISSAIWIYLLALRGGFWRCREREDRQLPHPDPARWPSVVAVIPARNEADMIPGSLGSLLRQDYPGPFSVILVDDNSEDGTRAVAGTVAAVAPDRVAVVAGAPLPDGWTGKLWAMHQGIEAARSKAPEYLLLTDADIAYEPLALRSLVRRAEAEGRVLVSLMAKLRCASRAEQLLIPAFIFFFQKLYPFAWVNRPRKRTAAAAGGCMLVRRSALEAAGGIASIRGALIDDCTLGATMKRAGPIWLGLANGVHSLRPYPAFSDIRTMVTRSAYAQLHYSPWLLAGTVVAMILTYLAAPMLAAFGGGPARVLALATWALMSAAFLPTLRYYGVSPLWSPALPAIAAIYLGFTVESAWQHARGRGGMWKGRAQARPAGLASTMHSEDGGGRADQ